VILGPGDVVPALPQTGPATVQFSTVVGPLGPGTHRICVTATGSDLGGTGGVDDCVEVDSAEVVVDCSTPGPCLATATDGAVSAAEFRAGADFVKTVGITSVDAAPDACGGLACTTAYDVMFDDDGGAAVAELTVVMAKDQSTPPGHAAMFLDGVRVTALCANSLARSPIPCVKISSTNSGQTRYFVRFAADPRFTFR
jgi:hypothetical protein